MSVVTLDGEILHYEVLGRGRPLIFLHGWVGSWRYWVPTMQAASMGYRAYALDLWGFGESAKRISMYGLENQVAMLDQFMDQLGIAKIALIGHGLGALVALSFAARFPRLVDRLMVSSLPLGAGMVNARLKTSPLPELADWMLGRAPGTDSARVEAPKADPQAVAASLESLQLINTMDVAQGIVTPCLMVYGQNDLVVQSPAQDVLAGLPEQFHAIFFEQAGHFPMLDDSNKFNRLLNDFLALPSGDSPRQLQLKEEWKRRVR